MLTGAGILGGILSANVGSGIDIVTFIVLTLAFGVDEKIATPTTVVIMAITAAAGFLLRGVVIADVAAVQEYWLLCVPVVIVGAPVGAMILARCRRHHIVVFLLLLIGLEVCSTFLLVAQSREAILFGCALVLVSSLAFWCMIRYRLYTNRASKAAWQSVKR
jgi:uncharacterized membrane protein YfcA